MYNYFQMDSDNNLKNLEEANKPSTSGKKMVTKIITKKSKMI